MRIVLIFCEIVAKLRNWDCAEGNEEEVWDAVIF